MGPYETASIAPILFITTTTIFQFIIRSKLDPYMNTSRLRTRADWLITFNIAVLTFLAAVQTTRMEFIHLLHFFSGYTAGMILQEAVQGIRKHKSNTNQTNQDKNRKR